MFLTCTLILKYLCLIIPTCVIRRKNILQSMPDAAIDRSLLRLLKYLRSTIPSISVLLEIKFYYFPKFLNLSLQHTIQIKEEDGYMCFHSCRWNPICRCTGDSTAWCWNKDRIPFFRQPYPLFYQPSFSFYIILRFFYRGRG